MSEITDQQLAQRMIDQLITVWINPSIHARQQANELPKPLKMFAAQIVFSGDERPALVRLNEDVWGTFHAEIKGPPSFKAGDKISVNVLENITSWAKDQTDDPNCGYVTLVWWRDRCRVFYDLRYNRAHSQSHIDAARKFLAVAEYSAEQEFWSPFVDNLYSAAELSAKAFLFSIPATKMDRCKKHSYIHAKLNIFSATGFIDPKHATSFNKLYHLRGPARYLKQDVSFSPEEKVEMLSIVRAMIEDVDKKLA